MLVDLTNRLSSQSFQPGHLTQDGLFAQMIGSSSNEMGLEERGTTLSKKARQYGELYVQVAQSGPLARTLVISEKLLVISGKLLQVYGICTNSP